MMKRLLRGGARSSAPQHYSGARVVSARAFSHARSLTAAAVALAMMATVAVSALLPTYSATADDGSLAGSTCANFYWFGDDTSITGSDTGVATYVGGDMYVGGKPSNADALNSATGPTGTYAVEAEGLTVVNGSLAMNPKKRAWRLWNTGSAGGTSYVSRGFRWGRRRFWFPVPSCGRQSGVGCWRKHFHICDGEQGRRLDRSWMARQDEFH